MNQNSHPGIEHQRQRRSPAGDRSQRATLTSNFLIVVGLIVLSAAVALVASTQGHAETMTVNYSVIAPEPTIVLTPVGADATRAASSGGAQLPAPPSPSDSRLTAGPIIPSPTPTTRLPDMDTVASLTAGGYQPDDSSGSEPAVASPAPSPTMPPPTHISISAVGIDTDVIEVTSAIVDFEGQQVQQWQVADWAAGHHDTSANPGEGGNIVIAGHDDVRGEVFRGLHDIQLGDEVVVTSAAGSFQYVVKEIHMRRWEDVPLPELLAIGEFMASMPEERLTLITCWPYGIDNHRMIVVAKPVGGGIDAPL